MKNKIFTIGIMFVMVIGTLFVMPGNVMATPDSNNGFASAELVYNTAVNTTSVDVGDDAEDYYKIYLEAGEEVFAQLSVPVGQDFDLYLIAPDETTQLDLSEIDNPGTGNYYEEVNGTATITGWYYLVVVAFSGNGDYTLQTRATAEWTFMVYLDGDNNLEVSGITDFLEMSTVGSTRDVNIIVQFDRIAGYDTQFGDWEDCNRYYVTQGMTPTAANAIENIGEVNMADPLTLVDFGNWSVQNFPAKKYALVLWDHGMSWHGLCSDDTSGGGHINMSQLSSALATIQIDNGGLVLDIVDFDACLMGSVEVAYQLEGYANYMIGSEKTEPGYGLDYNNSLASLVNNPAMTPLEFCQQILITYENYYYGDIHPDMYNRSITLSVTDLNTVNDVVVATNNLAMEFINNMGKYVYLINYSRNQTEEYDGPYSGQDRVVDLYHFAEQVINIPDATVQSLASQLMNAINASVKYETHGTNPNLVGPPEVIVENAHGLTVYFPETQAEYETEYTEDPDFGFPADTWWAEFLDAFYTEVATTNTAPTIDTFDPVTDPTINEGESQPFTITASDADGHVLLYQWYLDGEEIVNATGTTYTFDTNYTSSGVYEITVLVWDGDQFDGLYWTLTVNDVDITPPNSSVDAMPAYWHNTAVTITATATDTNSSVANVTLWYRYSNNNSTWGNWVSFGLDTTAPWSWIFDFSDGDGYYEFYSIANNPSNTIETAPSTADSACAYDATEPSVNAGANQEVVAGTLVNFTGSGSSDNIGINNYTWTLTYNGSVVTLYEINPQFKFWTTGNYTVTLNITDAAGNWNTTTMAVKTVVPPDTTSPVADAGTDQTVDEGTWVTLSASSSTDNVGIANYTWTFNDGVADISYTGTGILAIHNFTLAGNYTVTLNVTDAEGNWDTDTMIVAVTALEEEPPTDEGTDDDNSGMLMIVLVVIILAVVGVVIYLIKGKGKTPSKPEEEEMPETPTDENKEV